MAAKQEKKTFRQSLRYPTRMSRKNCGPHPESQEQRPRGEPGRPLAWPSQALKPPQGGRRQTNQAVELELSSPQSRHASSPSSTVLTQTPRGAWISACTQHPSLTSVLRRGLTESKDLPHRQQVRPPPPRIRGDHVGSRSPPLQATARSLPTGVSAGLNQGPWTSAFSGLRVMSEQTG